MFTFGKIRPQKGNLKGKRLDGRTSARAKRAYANHMLAKDHSTMAAQTQTTLMISPVLVAVRTSELPYAKGNIRLYPCPNSNIEYPPWPIGPSGMKTLSTDAPGGRPYTTRRRRYMVSIMKASVRPIETMQVDTASVMRACRAEKLYMTGARIPPEDDATMRVTTGSNHTAVIRLRA